MLLEAYVDNKRTDKNTSHSYLPVYENVLRHHRESAQHVLEIGIAQGGSIKLWRDYFVNATIHGVDIYDKSELPQDLQGCETIKCYTQTDAYSDEFCNKIDFPLDVVIDDGPHTPASQVMCIKKYFPKLAKGGVLIIEDIPTRAYFHDLVAAIPQEIPYTWELHDLKGKKNRFDDMLFIVHKI